jgi:hypothetical protein
MVRCRRSILPVVVGELGSGEDVLDPVVVADPIEQHLGGLVRRFGGEDASIIGEDRFGDPVAGEAFEQGDRIPMK